MTIEITNLPADGSNSPPGVPPARPNSLPPNCNPDHYLNWRFCYAMHLVACADRSPVTHDDPWVQAAIDFCVAAKSHTSQSRNQTPTHLAVCAATDLWRSDSLAKYLLEARLRAQETPDDIHRRCGLPPLTIAAYSKLHFDACRDRVKIWFNHPFASAAVVNSEMHEFGLRLGSMANTSSSEELERCIRVLQRIEGETLAAGLPSPGDPQFAQEIVPRRALARMLVPINSPTETLLNHWQEAAANHIRAGRTSQDTVEMVITILRKVKLPVSLQHELQSMREALAATCEIDAAANE